MENNKEVLECESCSCGSKDYCEIVFDDKK